MYFIWRQNRIFSLTNLAKIRSGLTTKQYAAVSCIAKLTARTISFRVVTSRFCERVKAAINSTLFADYISPSVIISSTLYCNDTLSSSHLESNVIKHLLPNICRFD